jgi:hypothetical protein
MKLSVVAAIAYAVIAPSPIRAATLSYTQTGDVYAIVVDAEEHNGAFETVVFEARPMGSSAFANQATGNVVGIPRPPGDPFTYMNRLLTAHPLDFPDAIGYGLSLFELVNPPDRLFFVLGRQRGNISTASEPGGDLFLANLYMPGGAASAEVTVQLLGGGILVRELRLTIPVPEASLAASTACALVAATIASRRRRLS